MTESQNAATARGTTAPGRPALVKDAAYWARVRRIVDQAPPLSDEQCARIRAAIHRPQTGGRAAA